MTVCTLWHIFIDNCPPKHLNEPFLVIFICTGDCGDLLPEQQKHEWCCEWGAGDESSQTLPTWDVEQDDHLLAGEPRWGPRACQHFDQQSPCGGTGLRRELFAGVCVCVRRIVWILYVAYVENANSRCKGKKEVSMHGSIKNLLLLCLKKRHWFEVHGPLEWAEHNTITSWTFINSVAREVVFLHNWAIFKNKVLGKVVYLKKKKNCIFIMCWGCGGEKNPCLLQIQNKTSNTIPVNPNTAVVMPTFSKFT